jgi:2'-5' RNA ligase
MQIKQEPSLIETSYPTFHPHVTLLSLPRSLEDHIDSIKVCVAKYRTKPPPVCRFKSVDIGDHYYRSVYVAIQPTLELLGMHKYFHDKMEIEPRTPAFPHLSLCYIDDADAENGERQAFYDALKDTGELGTINEDDRVEGVSLKCGSDNQDWIDHFNASEVWAVLCEGPVEGWRVLQKFSLTPE